MNKRFLAAISCAALALSATLCSCTNSTITVMKVDGEKIYAYEYVYYLSYFKKSYEDSYGSEIWTHSDGESGMENYVKQLAANQAVFRQEVKKAAEAEGIKLEKEDIRTLKNNKKEDMETAGGAAAWQQSLAQAGSSPRMYDDLAETSMLYNKLNDKLFGKNGTKTLSDEEFLEYYKENYISAAHILVKTTDDEDNELSDEQKAEKKKQAEQLLALAKKPGTDFDKLAAENSDDTGIKTNPHGYTFTEGTMVSEFYNGAAALEENQISEIIESQYGYHIIKRLPLDMEYFEQNKEELKNAYYEKEFSKYLDEQGKQMQIEYTDAYEKIGINNLSAYR